MYSTFGHVHCTDAEHQPRNKLFPWFCVTKIQLLRLCTASGMFLACTPFFSIFHPQVLVEIDSYKSKNVCAALPIAMISHRHDNYIVTSPRKTLFLNLGRKGRQSCTRKIFNSFHFKFIIHFILNYP